MPRRSISTAKLCLAFAALASLAPFSHGQVSMTFEDGADRWRTVVDGVMGGRSTANIAMAEPGVMAFTGNLSLENNGGFSSIRTAVTGTGFADADGIEINCLGDGRTYTLNVSCSNVRLMAGSYQQSFETTAGEWTTVRLSFDDFVLYNFGREVRDAPELARNLIESVGVTLSDKNEGDFEIRIRSIESYGGASDSSATDADQTGTDLASVASGAGLNTLLRLVKASEITLPEGPLTIFAPTDEAFAALPAETLEHLLSPEGRSTLQTILAFHVVPSARSSSELLNLRSLSTASGQPLTIDGLTVSGANLLAVDVPFDGGVVHVINAVMMPELRSIVELTGETEDLSTLAAAVGAAGLANQLGHENGPFTVFAPVNSAFADLPEGALDALLKSENRNALISVLGLHVIPGRIEARELLTMQQAQTLLGQPVAFSLVDGQLQVGNATVIAADINAANGVVHLIDTVLLPESAPTEERTASNDFANSAAALCVLAIERGVPLYNAGQHEACAAVYEVTIEAIIRLGDQDLDRDMMRALQQVLDQAAEEHDAADRAWAYRAALDAVYDARDH